MSEAALCRLPAKIPIRKRDKLRSPGFGASRRGPTFPAYPERQFVAAAAAVSARFLAELRGRLGLVLGLPGLVRHPVDDLPRLFLAEREPLSRGRLMVPAGETIAAEARKLHQVDVLHVGPLAQMRYEPAEGGGLELGPGALVELPVLHLQRLGVVRLVGMRAVQFDRVQRIPGVAHHLGDRICKPERPLLLPVGSEDQILTHLDQRMRQAPLRAVPVKRVALELTRIGNVVANLYARDGAQGLKQSECEPRILVPKHADLPRTRRALPSLREAVHRND